MCVAVVTQNDCRLLLELDGEPILLELRCTAVNVTQKVRRLEAWLSTQGWRRVTSVLTDRSDCEV